MNKWTRLICLVSICLCLTPSGVLSAETPVKGGVLVWGRPSEAVNLDPGQNSDMGSNQCSAQIFDTLVAFAYEELKLEPGLATSWKVSDDGLTWRFNLRQGVKFHNGESFTALDVKNTIERVIHENHPFYKYGKWSSARAYFAPVKEVKVVDDHTVDIVTEKPYAPLPNNLAMPFCGILSTKAMSEFKDQISNHPIGTGPFKMVKWDKGDQVIFERNDDFWGPKALMDKLIIKAIPDPSSRLMALQSGTIDMADDLDPEAILNIVKKDPNLYVLEKTGCGIGYLSINCEKPHLNNPLVRRAIYHAVDKKTLLQAIWQGLGMVAKNPYPPTAAWYYDDDIKDYEYNPAKAKELLKEAGLPDGFEMNFFVMPLSRPYMPDPIKTGELVQAYLAAVGIKAKIVRYDWGTYLKKCAAGEHDMFIIGWMGANGDPDAFLYTLLSGDMIKVVNWARWNNAEYTELVTKARQLFDRAERAKLYKRAIEIFHEDAPWVPLAHNKVLRCVNKKVHDVPLFPGLFGRMDKVWKEK